MSVTKEKIFDTVEASLAEEEEKEKPNYGPSKHWWYSFSEESPLASVRTPETLSRSRWVVSEQSILHVC